MQNAKMRNAFVHYCIRALLHSCIRAFRHWSMPVAFRRAFFSGLLAALTVLAGTPVRAQQLRRPMSLVDLAELPRILDPQLSPDGRSVIYTLTRADWKANRAVPHIWRQSVGGGQPTQLTNGDAGEASARWSPDSKSLLFLARRDETDTQIYLLPSEGGEAQELTRHGTSVSQPAWSPDGSAIYFLASDPPTSDERDRDHLKDDVFAFEKNFKQRHLWRVTVPSGAELKLTDGDFSVLSYRPSRDGRQIALHRAPTPLVDDSVRSEVWVMDASGRNTRAVTSNSVEELEAELSPDNTQILFLAEANSALEPYYSSTIFLVPAGGGAPRLLLPDFPYGVEHASWTPDGAIVASVNMGTHSEIFRIDVAARRAKALTDGRHSVQFWSVVPAARRMIFQLDEPTRIGDAWTLPLDGGTPTRVTGIYDSLERNFNLPRQDKVAWKGADGVTVEGLLFYPLAYEAGKRYPLVVQMHGGPSESDKFGYGPGVIVNYMPVLTARGYAVLRPNYRGSAGYGNAFLRDIVGSYFKNMHLDVMAGIDYLVHQGIADPDRLAVMGWSAGGHLTNKLITFTNRFKAASSSAGAADWTSMFAQTDLRSDRTLWFGGSPWQADAPIDVYWSNSPLKDAARVKTPTLFFVGQEDSRVPMPQSVEMYRALVANAVPTRLYVAPREGHQWTELRHQLYKANAELEWFERYVMDRSYNWERAPGDGAKK
jgi:dipeptidyl aminopeptidase/acylaminoacyl peptidase